MNLIEIRPSRDDVGFAPSRDEPKDLIGFEPPKLSTEEMGTNIIGAVLGGIAGYSLARKKKTGGAILGVIVGGWAGYLFGHSVWGKKP